LPDIGNQNYVINSQKNPTTSSQNLKKKKKENSFTTKEALAMPVRPAYIN